MGWRWSSMSCGRPPGWQPRWSGAPGASGPCGRWRRPGRGAEAARAWAPSVREAGEGVLLAGERGGLPPQGFDRGNSPAELMGLELRGRRLVLTTTNGTRALEAVAGSGEVLVTSLRHG